jgi:hypothetical protein
MDIGDLVRHGPYVVETIEVLEKDDSVLATTTIPAEDGAFTVPMVCTLFFEPRLFTPGLGNFGIGNGIDQPPPYLEPIKGAILIATRSHFDGIGMRFFTAIRRTTARGLVIEVRDVTSVADENSRGVIMGGTALQETGDKFLVKSNIFGWTEETFPFQGESDPDSDHFIIQVGADGLLNANNDQASDDSIVLNEVFGPLGVSRQSTHEPFSDPSTLPLPTKPRTITNGKVEGRIDAVDVANTAVSLSEDGIITVTSTNPALVPTQRATEITRALNAFANSLGIFGAHELAHGLGLIAKADRKRAFIEVDGKGTFLSPLAGVDGSHNPKPLGELMDEGKDIRSRTVFTPGKRLPLGDNNKRYLEDCFPVES